LSFCEVVKKNERSSKGDSRLGIPLPPSNDKYLKLVEREKNAMHFPETCLASCTSRSVCLGMLRIRASVMEFICAARETESRDFFTLYRFPNVTYPFRSTSLEISQQNEQKVIASKNKIASALESVQKQEKKALFFLFFSKHEEKKWRAESVCSVPGKLFKRISVRPRSTCPCYSSL
jgi:hypothetical protein